MIKSRHVKRTLTSTDTVFVVPPQLATGKSILVQRSEALIDEARRGLDPAVFVST